jgi:hypothetical protein
MAKVVKQAKYNNPIPNPEYTNSIPQYPAGFFSRDSVPLPPYLEPKDTDPLFKQRKT